MKIAVIGPGSMGLLYGAKLSAFEDVLLIGNNEENIRAINECGVTVKRDGAETLYHPKAVRRSGRRLKRLQRCFLRPVSPAM